jgi:hypothetical protein
MGGRCVSIILVKIEVKGSKSVGKLRAREKKIRERKRSRQLFL